MSRTKRKRQTKRETGRRGKASCALQPSIEKARRLYDAGESAAARSICGRLITESPDDPEALHLLALIDLMEERFREAVETAKRLADRYPADPRFVFTYAWTLQSEGDTEQAEDAYKRTLRLDPRHFAAWYNLGLIFRDSDRPRDAMEAFRRAISIDPTDARPHFSLGRLLFQLGVFPDAVSCLDRATRLDPTDGEAWCLLGRALQKTGRAENAIEAYERCLELDSEHFDAHYRLGFLQMRYGRSRKALDAFAAASRIKPDHDEALNRLVYVKRLLCDWTDLEPLTERLLAAVREERGAVYPYFTLFATASQELHYTAARSFSNGRFSGKEYTVGKGAVFEFSRTRKDKIVVGYLSEDFREHAVSRLVWEMFQFHDRDRFHIIGYSTGPEDSSELRRRMIEGLDRFTDLRGRSPREAATLIHQDHVDILVDMNAYIGSLNPAVIAMRPAPIQVSFLGYPGTSGLRNMDYIIADRFLIPPELEPFYSEALVKMPDCWQVNPRSRPSPEETPTRAECGLPENALVFACPHGAQKITPSVFGVWSRLLSAIPDAVLWIVGADPDAVENLRAEAVRLGTDLDRIVFTKVAPYQEFIGRLQSADLLLDTHPYNAGSTAADALWAGCPTLTLAGESYASRMAGSLLSVLGMDELIAYSLDEYEEKAVYYATNRGELKTLGTVLKLLRRTSPLYDCPRFVGLLEAAFERMYETFLSGAPPTGFNVDPPS